MNESLFSELEFDVHGFDCGYGGPLRAFALANFLQEAAGASAAVAQALVGQVKTLEPPQGVSAGAIKVVGPEEKTAPVSTTPEGKPVATGLSQPGTYRVSAGGVSLPELTFAVNVDPRESDPAAPVETARRRP